MPLELVFKKLSLIKNFGNKFFLNRTGQLNCNCNKIACNRFFFKVIKTVYFFKMLIDIITVDLVSKQPRFELIYNFLNLIWNVRFFYTVFVTETSVYSVFNSLNIIFSIEQLYANANWLERENWDMFGILFFNNSDLRRILTDYGFEGFPLRKDFPLTGFLELRYDEEQKSILYEKVELTQEFRFFDFESPWKR